VQKGAELRGSLWHVIGKPRESHFLPISIKLSG